VRAGVNPACVLEWVLWDWIVTKQQDNATAGQDMQDINVIFVLMALSRDMVSSDTNYRIHFKFTHFVRIW